MKGVCRLLSDVSLIQKSQRTEMIQEFEISESGVSARAYEPPFKRTCSLEFEEVRIMNPRSSAQFPAQADCSL